MEVGEEEEVVRLLSWWLLWSSECVCVCDGEEREGRKEGVCCVRNGEEREVRKEEERVGG